MDQRRGGGLSAGHIIGDPFALVTISIAIVSGRHTLNRNPNVTDSKTARVVDSIRCVNSLGYRQPISQLCLVGNCVHAMLHNRHHSRGRIGLC
jgi:hypothetical protein